MTFQANHLAGARWNKYNYNQVTKQKPNTLLMNTTNICKPKPNETEAWYKSLLHYSGRKWTVPILQLPRPARGYRLWIINL